VLLIDLSPEGAREARDLLASEPAFRVQAARSLEQAHELLVGDSFDAVLVDYDLWNEEQAHLVRFMREERGDVAVVLLTDGQNDLEALPALKLGAHDFVSRRNLDRAQLAARIFVAVEESRTVRRRDTMVRWLEREARTDHLTGLFNRRTFDERLREACEEGRRENAPVTLVLIDIAGTRMVNESHGHEAGDAMIRRAAWSIARSTRAVDFGARLGGDDFAVIIAGEGLDVGLRIARRIAHEVERLNASSSEIPVSLAFGVASGTGCGPQELFAAAEQQLVRRPAPRALVTPLPVAEDDGPSVA
jgi:two-component system cell cycle response regulator